MVMEGLQFDAVRGVQAKREFYIMMCPFATIKDKFRYEDDPRIDPQLKAQRKIRDSRIPKIASYIKDNYNNYIFSSITISVGKKMQFIPAPGRGSDGKCGSLIIPHDAPILINDGQHRCAAIRSICENDDFYSENISVVVYEDRGLKRSQQMFADLNKHATKPTKSLGLLYDHRNQFAQFIVNLADDLDIFYGRTEKARTNISNRSTAFFTLNGIFDATRYLFRLKTKSISSEKQKIAREYWEKVAKNIPEWNLLMAKKITPYELRQEYVHAHTNVLNALGLVGYVLLQKNDWRKKLKGLQKINWKKTSPIWQNKVVMDGKMLKNRLGIKRAANEILKQLGVSDTVDGGA